MGDLSAEPSMEDILSSIKRIIAEEADPAAPTRGRRLTSPRLVETDDVLELRQPVAEPSAPASEPTPFDAVRVRASDTPVDMPAPQLQPQPVIASSAEPQPVMGSGPQPILSADTARASRHSFDSLSRLVVRPDVAGSDTLEGLVADLLRPMLREWLDQNLPELVERLVQREIARITGQGD